MLGPSAPATSKQTAPCGALFAFALLGDTDIRPLPTGRTLVYTDSSSETGMNWTVSRTIPNKHYPKSQRLGRKLGSHA